MADFSVYRAACHDVDEVARLGGDLSIEANIGIARILL
jgi:hypothetical protein